MLKRRNSFHVSIMVVLIILIWSFSYVGMALTVEKLTFEDIVHKAETIAIGVVEKAEAAYGEGKRSRRIFTSYTLSLSQVIKGDIGVDTPFQIRIIGGRVGDISHYIPGAPRLETGGKYLLFAYGKDKYMIPLVGTTQGIYTIVQNESGIEHVVSMQGAQLISRNTQAARKPGAETLTNNDKEMALEDFIEKINAVLR